MAICKLKISGVSAILMHNPAAMRQSSEITRGGKKIPTAYDEAKAGLYIMPGASKQLYIAPDCFREASLIAAADVRDPTKKGRASMVRRFSASVFLSTEYCPLVRASGNHKPITSDDDDWTIDTRRAVVQKQGILRSRAKITDWACPLEFEYDPELIEPPLIAAIVAQSGKFPGVLDYRVGRKGQFGRYTAILDNGASNEQVSTHKKPRR